MCTSHTGYCAPIGSCTTITLPSSSRKTLVLFLPMPQSMRAQTQAHRKRQEYRKADRSSREKALELVQQNQSVREVAALCAISRGTAFRISKRQRTSDSANSSRVMGPVCFLHGLRHLFHSGEGYGIMDRLFVETQGDFAADKAQLTAVIPSAAADG